MSLEQRAMEGDVSAQYEYGIMCIEGLGNTEKGIEWLGKAANQGSGLAQDKLSLIFLDLNDLQKARFWALKGIESGSPMSNTLIDRIDAKLKEEREIIQNTKTCPFCHTQVSGTVCTGCQAELRSKDLHVFFVFLIIFFSIFIGFITTNAIAGIVCFFVLLIICGIIVKTQKHWVRKKLR